ncbi:MAG: hypothetical protein ACKVU0_12720 [Saprospiraceae bacterium]
MKCHRILCLDEGRGQMHLTYVKMDAMRHTTGIEMLSGQGMTIA